MNDSWQVGMKKLRIPRPKMTVTRESRPDQRQRRPVDPPRDYNLSDDAGNDAADAVKSRNCCDHENHNSNSSDSNFS